jgi:hypothetical protein
MTAAKKICKLRADTKAMNIPPDMKLISLRAYDECLAIVEFEPPADLVRTLVEALESVPAIAEEIRQKWDEGQQSGKLLIALIDPSLNYRPDVSKIHAALDAAKGNVIDFNGVRAERYIDSAIDGFFNDPPDSNFQAGFLSALIVVKREALGRSDDKLNAAERMTWIGST